MSDALLSDNSNSQKMSLRKMVKNARLAMEKREDKTNHDNLHQRQTERAGQALRRRSVDCVVTPPPTGGVVFSNGISHMRTTCTSPTPTQPHKPAPTPQSSSHTETTASTPTTVSIFQRHDAEDPNHSSLSSVSNVSSMKSSKDGLSSSGTLSSSNKSGSHVSPDSSKKQQNNQYDRAPRRSSLPNLQYLTKPKAPPPMAGSYMNNVYAGGEDSMTSFQESAASSFSDLTSSQDLNSCLDLFNLSRASLVSVTSSSQNNNAIPSSVLKMHQLRNHHHHGNGLACPQTLRKKNQPDGVHLSWQTGNGPIHGPLLCTRSVSNRSLSEASIEGESLTPSLLFKSQPPESMKTTQLQKPTTPQLVLPASSQNVVTLSKIRIVSNSRNFGLLTQSLSSRSLDDDASVGSLQPSLLQDTKRTTTTTTKIVHVHDDSQQSLSLDDSRSVIMGIGGDSQSLILGSSLAELMPPLLSSTLDDMADSHSNSFQCEKQSFGHDSIGQNTLSSFQSMFQDSVKVVTSQKPSMVLEDGIYYDKIKAHPTTVAATTGKLGSADPGYSNCRPSSIPFTSGSSFAGKIFLGDPLVRSLNQIMECPISGAASMQSR